MHDDSFSACPKKTYLITCKNAITQSRPAQFTSDLVFAELQLLQPFTTPIRMKQNGT